MEFGWPGQAHTPITCKKIVHKAKTETVHGVLQLAGIDRDSSPSKAAKFEENARRCIRRNLLHDASEYTALIEALGKIGAWQQAISLLPEMKKKVLCTRRGQLQSCSLCLRRGRAVASSCANSSGYEIGL